jgi:hypothetical protein
MMVTTGTKAALNSGGMELAWREWKRRPVPDQTWNNWKLHWSVAFTESRDIHRMTSPAGAFANQAVANAEQAEMMARSPDNLANAAIQKNDTVEKLVSANERLAKALADANAAIARLRLPGIAATTTGTVPPPHYQWHYSCMGPAGLLLDARLEGKTRALQWHMLPAQRRPRRNGHPHLHQKWQQPQHEVDRSQTLTVRASGPFENRCS